MQRVVERVGQAAYLLLLGHLLGVLHRVEREVDALHRALLRLMHLVFTLIDELRHLLEV